MDTKIHTEMVWRWDLEIKIVSGTGNDTWAVLGIEIKTGIGIKIDSGT